MKDVGTMRILLVTFLFFCLSAVQGRGIVSSITFHGNKKLKTDFLERIILAKINEPLDSGVLKADVLRLQRLSAVADAHYEVDSANNVKYVLEEILTTIPSLNVYTTNGGEFAYRAGFDEYNLFGRNINVGLFYQNDIYSSVGVYLRAPNIIGKRFGVAINTLSLSTLEPVFLKNRNQSNYRYHNESAELLVICYLNYKSFIEFGWGRFNEKYTYVSGATRADVPLNLKAPKTIFKFNYRYNHVNYTFQYSDGFKCLANFQYVHSNHYYLTKSLIGRIDLIKYNRIGEKLNLANRIRLGLAENLDIPFAPFAVDNNVNIRGVGNTIDRGTGSVILNTELRWTIVDGDWFVLQGNTFVDAGSWRTVGGAMNDFVRKDGLRIHPGAGIRIIHKKIFDAVVRLDYGFEIMNPNNPSGFVIGIGQYF